MLLSFPTQKNHSQHLSSKKYYTKKSTLKWFCINFVHFIIICFFWSSENRYMDWINHSMTTPSPLHIYLCLLHSVFSFFPQKVHSIIETQVSKANQSETNKIQKKVWEPSAHDTIKTTPQGKAGFPNKVTYGLVKAIWKNSQGEVHRKYITEKVNKNLNGKPLITEIGAQP